VAVTVPQQPFVVLDEGDRIVGVGTDAKSQFGPLLGSVLWESLPGSEPLFKPYYDTARCSGEPVEFVQFYDGNVARIRAVPSADGTLALYWQLLARIDTRTLGGLVRSLDEALGLLADEQIGVHRQALRNSLRVIKGGA